MSFSFNERFKVAISASGLTYKELSLRTNISTTSICRYLSNTRNPTKANEKKIIEALGFNEEDFYSEKPLDISKKDKLKNRNIDFYDLLYILSNKKSSLTKEEKKSLIKILKDS